MRRRRHRTALVHSSAKKLDAVKSEINVTPLVDVCLVLLIIFMVVGQKLVRGMEVPLPQAKHSLEKKDSGDQPIVSLVRDGAQVRHYFDQDLLPDVSALKRRVGEELRHKKGHVIFLKADAELTYGDVYPALIAINEAGSINIELGTTDPKKE